MNNSGYRQFNDNHKITEGSSKSYVLLGLLFAITMSTSSILILVIFFTNNSIIIPLTEKVPNGTFWKQKYYSPHAYPVNCDTLTCPILSLFYHQSLPNNAVLNNDISLALNNSLSYSILRSVPQLFDGLYTYHYNETEQQGWYITIESIKSVYSINEAKDLLRISPVLLTLTDAVNNVEINGNEFEIPVESGRTFHVTNDITNIGIKTYCVVGWDDTFAGGGFIIHGGLHSLTYYTGNVSIEAETSVCPNSRGSVEWLNDNILHDYKKNELYVNYNATKLRCYDPIFCDKTGFYTIKVRNPINWRQYQVLFNHFSDDNRFIETIEFNELSQYELEYIMITDSCFIKNDYCTYSFLTYSSFKKLKDIFVSQPDKTHKQYSVAFTAFNYTVWKDRRKVDLTKEVKFIPNIFDGNSLVFSPKPNK
ncbi:hypothetical protein EDI_334540 [Entamoeba dispar SAW760]|uniref:Uncharacterized protein n=1 Tax=Entamoeba dispar (strain ATCC PRA-260 / SAW760) TaxID=370354 RepID=B0EUK9_ENTDS|nr:uncharacterized protein EDI_334540 [Entamoeba dispar SAW760]EDR21785.1 hypothetical protein EDI_334540 [Entamoeba dispar SAW760]|eukprot:EDR21785.1 hypothetical protein EDI_334540 [Entamoeba dispar SAW760]